MYDGDRDANVSQLTLLPARGRPEALGAVGRAVAIVDTPVVPRYRITQDVKGASAMDKLSISQRIIAEKTVCVLLVRGQNPDGSPIFAYVAVRADKLTDFMEAQKSGMFYPEDYGVIVEAGDGEPSPEIRKKMEEEYGFNHEAMLDIPDRQKALDISSSLVPNSKKLPFA